MFHKNNVDPAETILKPNMTYCIDTSLKQFETPFAKKYKLIKCKTLDCDNLIVFGCYSHNMFALLDKRVNHKEPLTTYIIWGGSDFIPCRKILRQLILLKNNKIKHLAISNCLYKRLTNANLSVTRIQFNLVDTDLFKPVTTNIVSNTIYIYSGHPINRGRNSNTYGSTIFESIMKQLPQFNYILSHKLNVPYDKMPDIYAKCFIVLRLTQLDGNANTAQECETMNIPIVHNQSDNGLKWKTKEDVVTHIHNHASS
jgi:hypothetical protein